MELVIKSNPPKISIALLENKKLIELHEESDDNEFSVGDIYLGKVRKIVPDLNAAFVDIGHEKDAFLHYSDLGNSFRNHNDFTKQVLTGKNLSSLASMKMKDEIPKEGSIKDLVSGSQLVLAQVTKEPISSKGPKLTSEITLAGRYLVLIPFSNKISISQKIQDSEEKTRLKRLIESIKPPNFGVIVRTVAVDKKVAELDQDLRNLVERWSLINKGLKNALPKKRILRELNKTSAILRDILNADFTSINVDDPNLLTEVKEYISRIAPEKEKIVKLYKGSRDIFQHFGINKQIKASFGKKVNLPRGGYLIVEHTEAMHVIDVNSGGRRGEDATPLNVNLEAAEEIVRILKLRDMGGIIAVDFIDMYDSESNQKLYDKIKGLLKNDRARNNLIPPTKFGVVEITRQRVKTQTNIKTSELCPVCEGSGEVQATITIIDELEGQLRYLLSNNIAISHIEVHPFIEAYLKKGLFSRRLKWLIEFKRLVKIHPNTNYHFLKYNFFDKNNEIIE